MTIPHDNSMPTLPAHTWIAFHSITPNNHEGFAWLILSLCRWTDS